MPPQPPPATRFRLSWSWLPWALALAGCRATLPEVELVESFPVETSLDQPDLRETQTVWLEAIAGAQRSIDLAHFYFSDAPGSRLRPVIEALLAAGRRGVAIRVLADAGFERTYPETLAEFRAAPGFEVRSYDLRARTGGALHVKLLSVDGQRAFIGSQNFDYRSLEHIWELGAYVHSADLVSDIDRVFELDWYLAGHPEVSLEQALEDRPDRIGQVERVRVIGAGRDFGTATARCVFSPEQALPRGLYWDLPDLGDAIEQAEGRLRIAVLSFQSELGPGATDWLLPPAILRAAARGVEVRILVADWNKRQSRIGALQKLAEVENVEVRFAVIPEWSGGFQPFSRVAHSKLLVVDERRAWIGTGNFSPDYFYESRNAGLFLEGQGPSRRLAAQFDALWDSAYAEPVDPKASYTPRRYAE
jgi:phosphatidylserine/phosphatidylglycerophosphate/cardiolipin synthase-like enzyme